MVNFHQEHHEGTCSGSAEGGQVGPIGRDPNALELKDLVEANDGRADRNQDDHRPRGALMHVPQQYVKGQREEQPLGSVGEVGDHAGTDESRVRRNVRGCPGGVARDVHLADHVGKGEAAEDAVQQVEDSGDARETLG